MVYRFLRFPEGRAKAVTLSYDDGCRQDIRFSEIISEYGLRCTFNVTSDERCGSKALTVEQVRENFLDKGHEVAVHTSHHPFLERLPESVVVSEIMEDRKTLEKYTAEKFPSFP